MTVRIITGDCGALLRTMDDESVDVVVTSPPYYGQRNYDVEPQAWGGHLDCDHVWGEPVVDRTKATPGTSGSSLTNAGAWQSATSRFVASSSYCVHCGAWHGALGLEPTLGEYIEHLVGIFEEVRRVLKRWGTLWLNVGDGYAGGGMEAEETLPPSARTGAQSRSGPASGPR